MSNLFPVTYKVADTAKMLEGGAVISQTVTYHCKIIDATDSIAANTEVTQTGQAHWFRVPPRGIFLFAFNACRWNSQPDLGATEILDLNSRYSFPDGYLFQDVNDPSVMDVFDMREVIQNSYPIHLTPDAYVVSDQIHTTDQASAFPGLAAIRKEANEHGSILGYGDFIAILDVGNYVGLSASIFKVPAKSTCSAGNSRVVALDEASACWNLSPCQSENSLAEGVLCLEKVSDLKVNPSPDFSQVDLYKSNLKDARSGERFYRATTVTSKLPLADKGPRWLPNVCIEGLCTKIAATGTSDLRIYMPDTHELMIAHLRFRSLSDSIAVIDTH